MKLGIMQPYFLPYIGYFSLIKHTDRFVLLDPVQFIRHGWIERNRILKQNEGWLYIKVPLLQRSRSTLIKDILIDNNQNWKAKILSQLQIYKKEAVYYYSVINIVDELFEKDYEDIVTLNKHAIEIICDYLGIRKEILVFSEMNLDIEKPAEPDEWALNICRAIGDVMEYWNPPGGMNIFNRNKYDKSNIALKFHKANITEYNQGRTKFESGLSILDVLMFNSAEEVNTMLDDFELL